MELKNKPQIIKQIEALWDEGLQLFLAPKQPNLIDGVMAFKIDMPKYALDEIGNLIGLNLAVTKLDDVKWNKIVKILDANLSSIQALNLSNNELHNFVLPNEMIALRRIDLEDNKMEHFALPDELTEVEVLRLEGNPLSSPPPEVVEQGSKGILAYFASFKKGKSKKQHFLKEIKILLVGEGMAGKTSLLKLIQGLPFDPYESQTHGINVQTLEMGKLSLFKSHKAVKDVKLHIWDFGGQEIMHASHQFFLTHRSIYVFVLDSRTDNKKDYWLRHIQKFGGDSPAIIVMNKMDENNYYSLEESTLNRKYPFLGNRFIKLSCKTGMGKEQLAQTLVTLIPETPLFQNTISDSWLNIKNQLEKETSKRKYIDQKRFLDICESFGEKNVSGQDTLLHYLNALGVVLHFPGLALQSFYVLDPHWVTIGVYKIINSPSVNNGVLDEENLNFILNMEDQKKEEYDPSKEKAISYSPAEQLYIIGIMKEFELLYEYKKGRYLIPDLLPKELSNPISFQEDQSIKFIMEYDFLPSSVMSRFIIYMKNDIGDISNIWRTGAFLSNRDYYCEALIIADTDRRRISILVNGVDQRKREYFAIIRHGLTTINSKFSNLKVIEKMPVPSHPEIEIDYEELLGLEKMEEDRFIIGRLGKAFSVSHDFLDKISTKSDRLRTEFREQVSISKRLKLAEPSIRDKVVIKSNQNKDFIDLVAKMINMKDVSIEIHEEAKEYKSIDFLILDISDYNSSKEIKDILIVDDFRTLAVCEKDLSNREKYYEFNDFEIVDYEKDHPQDLAQEIIAWLDKMRDVT